jgi:hypothetical protein
MAKRLSDAVRHARPSPGSPARWRGATIRALRILAFGMIAYVATAVAAQAACTVTTGSTSGATISISGTGGANTVSLCVTDNKVLWGLYGSSNGANPNVDANFGLPMTGAAFGPGNETPLPYTSSKATYTIMPFPAPDYNSVPQYDITLNTVTGSGTDTITLWYASNCSASGACGGVSQYTNTSFTITVNLPVPPTVTGIAPTSGPTAGGTAVTITGTDFTGATAVTIGGVAATGITVVNATTITATTGARAAGTVDVAVTTPGG